jgi:hypothetical protein
MMGIFLKEIINDRASDYIFLLNLYTPLLAAVGKHFVLSFLRKQESSIYVSGFRIKCGMTMLFFSL